MKKNPVSKLLLALALLGGGTCIPAAHADLVIYDGSDYALGVPNPDPDGGLNNNHGLSFPSSTGFRNSYGTNTTVVAGLSYTNAGGTLNTSGNALRRVGGTSWANGETFPYRFMTADPFISYRSTATANTFGWNGSYATELYYSVLLNWSAINTGTDNRLVVKLGRDNSNFNTYLGQNGTNWNFSDQLGNSFTFAPAVAGETVLIVTRLSFESATSFTTDYWFNPVLGAALGTPSHSRTYTTTTSGGQFWGHMTRDGVNILTFDEFRLGTTATSVMAMTGVVAPTAPTGFAAIASTFTNVNLSWVDTSNNEIDFVIERSLNGTTGWRQIAIPAANSTAFADSGLTALTTYHYRIRSANGGGSSAFSSTVSVTTPAAAVATPPPTNLVGTVDSFSEITLNWNDNSFDETSFTLESSPDGITGWTTLVTLAPDVTTYQHIGLTAATTYHYRITATSPAGVSLPSNVASATTAVLPPPVALAPIYLPFEDDADTELNLANVVTGFTAYSYSAPTFVRSTSALSYPGLTAPLGNGLETVLSNRIYLSLDTSLPGLAQYVSGGQIGGSGLGVLYVRWLASGVKGQEANTIDFRTDSINANNTRAAVGTTFGNDFIRAMADSTGNGVINNWVNSALTPAAGTDLYVARFTFSPSGNTVMDVFVNQLTEGTPDASVTGKIKFNTIGFSKFGGTTPPSLDEFRIATSWTEAVDASGASSAYDTWAASPFAMPFGNTGAGVDFELDGLTNLMEFVLGGDPTINDTPSIRPAVTAAGTALVVTFNRSDASELAPLPTAVKVQVSSNLVVWNPADDITIGATSGTGPNGVTYTVTENGAAADTIVVTIPKAAAPVKFARVVGTR